MTETEDGIKIAGINRRYFPAEYGCPGTDKYCGNIGGTSENPPVSMAVLVLGQIGDYAVYVGHSEDPIWVARFGNKISFQEAQAQFSGLEKEKYREQ